ncbi:MAG: glucose-1-phosphate thymidylyltransferase RfbA [Deltaproteobacteria bacterium]|nr:glucose-1-phosphate thymidylyltransferase RfbA [Deltaproteobacteria bacterium]
MNNHNLKRKGIILAGGSGTRLHPATRCVSKQLIPVYNKPMVYYPLCTLLLSGVRDILVITTPQDQSAFQRLLGDGSWLGVNIQYAVQDYPGGLAQSFIIGRTFVGSDAVALVLGDNIHYGHGLPEMFNAAAERKHGATVFCYFVKDPERYGVLEFDPNGAPRSIVEKPTHPRSPYAVTGLYFYDNQVLDIAAALKPSPRGELEITDVNAAYLKEGKLFAEKMGRGVAWFDTGTYASLLQASVFVQSIEERQGLMVACPEEIAFRRGYIGAADLEKMAETLRNNSYGQYLLRLLSEET